jgi:hypothetical protein
MFKFSSLCLMVAFWTIQFAYLYISLTVHHELTFNQYRARQPVSSDTPDGACTIETS